MADLNPVGTIYADVIRLENTTALLPGKMRAGMDGFETDLLHRYLHKPLAGGSALHWTPDEYRSGGISWVTPSDGYLGMWSNTSNAIVNAPIFVASNVAAIVAATWLGYTTNTSAANGRTYFDSNLGNARMVMYDSCGYNVAQIDDGTMTLKSLASGCNPSYVKASALGVLSVQTGIPTTDITGWPGNSAGYLYNNGSGTLTWAAVSGGITGSGTTGKLTKWTTGGSVIGDSLLAESAQTITMQYAGALSFKIDNNIVQDGSHGPSSLTMSASYTGAFGWTKILSAGSLYIDVSGGYIVMPPLASSGNTYVKANTSGVLSTSATVPLSDLSYSTLTSGFRPYYNGTAFADGYWFQQQIGSSPDVYYQDNYGWLSQSLFGAFTTSGNFALLYNGTIGARGIQMQAHYKGTPLSTELVGHSFALKASESAWPSVFINTINSELWIYNGGDGNAGGTGVSAGLPRIRIGAGGNVAIGNVNLTSGVDVYGQGALDVNGDAYFGAEYGSRSIAQNLGRTKISNTSGNATLTMWNHAGSTDVALNTNGTSSNFTYGISCLNLAGTGSRLVVAGATTGTLGVASGYGAFPSVPTGSSKVLQSDTSGNLSWVAGGGGGGVTGSGQDTHLAMWDGSTTNLGNSPFYKYGTDFWILQAQSNYTMTFSVYAPDAGLGGQYRAQNANDYLHLGISSTWASYLSIISASSKPFYIQTGYQTRVTMDYDTGNLTFAGFTKLGNDSRAVKKKYINMNTPSGINSSVYTAHGLADYTKVTEVTALIPYGNQRIPSGLSGAWEINCWIEGANVYLSSGSGTVLLSQWTEITITYMG